MVETKTIQESNGRAWLNIIIIVVALLVLGAGVFLYVKYDGKNASVRAGQATKDQSDVQIKGKLGSIEPGQKAPDFTLSDPLGKNYSLASFSDKPTFIVFEATWCTYCHQQNADVERIKKDFEGKINVVSIDLNEDAGTILNAWQQRNNTRLVLVDTDGSVSSKYGVTSTPTNVVINSDGTLLAKHPGLLGYDQIKDAINQII